MFWGFGGFGVKGPEFTPPGLPTTPYTLIKVEFRGLGILGLIRGLGDLKI